MIGAKVNMNFHAAPMTRLTAVLGLALRREAEAVAEAARAILNETTHGTGETAASVTVAEEGGVYSVRADSPAAPFLEFGTRDRPAKPFLRPACDAVRRGFSARIAEDCADFLQRPASKP